MKKITIQSLLQFEGKNVGKRVNNFQKHTDPHSNEAFHNSDFPTLE